MSAPLIIPQKDASPSDHFYFPKQVEAAKKDASPSDHFYFPKQVEAAKKGTSPSDHFYFPKQEALALPARPALVPAIVPLSLPAPVAPFLPKEREAALRPRPDPSIAPAESLKPAAPKPAESLKAVATVNPAAPKPAESVKVEEYPKGPSKSAESLKTDESAKFAESGKYGESGQGAPGLFAISNAPEMKRAPMLPVPSAPPLELQRDPVGDAFGAVLFSFAAADRFPPAKDGVSPTKDGFSPTKDGFSFAKDEPRGAAQPLAIVPFTAPAETKGPTRGVPEVVPKKSSSSFSSWGRPVNGSERRQADVKTHGRRFSAFNEDEEDEEPEETDMSDYCTLSRPTKKPLEEAKSRLASERKIVIHPLKTQFTHVQPKLEQAVIKRPVPQPPKEVFLSAMPPTRMAQFSLPMLQGLKTDATLLRQEVELCKFDMEMFECAETLEELADACFNAGKILTLATRVLTLCQNLCAFLQAGWQLEIRVWYDMASMQRTIADLLCLTLLRLEYRRSKRKCEQCEQQYALCRTLWKKIPELCSFICEQMTAPMNLNGHR